MFQRSRLSYRNEDSFTKGQHELSVVQSVTEIETAFLGEAYSLSRDTRKYRGAD